jgi:hypothetical protein
VRFSGFRNTCTNSKIKGKYAERHTCEKPANTIREYAKDLIVAAADGLSLEETSFSTKPNIRSIDSSKPLQNSLARESNPTMSYQDGIAMPIFSVTG